MERLTSLIFHFIFIAGCSKAGWLSHQPGRNYLFVVDDKDWLKWGQRLVCKLFRFRRDSLEDKVVHWVKFDCRAESNGPHIHIFQYTYGLIKHDRFVLVAQGNKEIVGPFLLHHTESEESECYL